MSSEQQGCPMVRKNTILTHIFNFRKLILLHGQVFGRSNLDLIMLYCLLNIYSAAQNTLEINFFVYKYMLVMTFGHPWRAEVQSLCVIALWPAAHCSLLDRFEPRT